MGLERQAGARSCRVLKAMVRRLDCLQRAMGKC